MPDTTQKANQELIQPDTTLNDTTLVTDTLNINPFDKLSPDALEFNVDYQAKDSIRIDVRSRKVYMYSGNEINYDQINLKAGYVEITFGKNEVYATGRTDTTGETIEQPLFTMGDNSFESEAIKYNYVTRKGLVERVITEDAEGYLHGEKVKKMPDNATNVYQGSYTTCNLEHPHFAFEFKKARVIPDNKIVTGPAWLVIEDMPTPLFVPFGLFPNKKGQRSGIVIPTWGESTSRGFYFENGGYYLAINDYMDLKLVGDIYTLGSWAVKPSMSYRKRYRYNGYINLGYAVNIQGIQGSADYSRSKDFKINWIHNQDPKARPKSKFSANVNIVSSKFNKYNPVSSNAYLSNTFQSSISYSTNFAGKYFLNISANQSQNTITRELNMSVPTMSFNVNRFYPFRRAKKIGRARWYDNISVNYSMAADNRINTYDTLLFRQDLLSQMKNGVKHTVGVSSGSIKLLKHLVWSNTINYTERWYSQQHLKYWNNDTVWQGTEPVTGQVVTDTVYGFNSVRDFSFSSNLGTTVYGMFSFTKGPVKAIRHVMRPSVGFSIRPDFGSPEWGYYRYYQNASGDVIKYSPWDGFIYGTAPDGRSGAINFRLSNNLEMKVKAPNDTVTGEKKVVLIEDLAFSTGYDIARDSLNWDKLSVSGRTTLFKQIRINYTALYDPYVVDSNGVRLNIFEWDVNRRLFRPEKFSWRLGLSWRISSDKLFGGSNRQSAGNSQPVPQSGTPEELRDIQENPEGYVDWNVPWSLNLSYDFNYNLSYIYENGYWNYDVSRQENIIQTLSFSGDVNITPKWKLGFRSGYDFDKKELTYTSIDVYRDLHCWEMRFNWIPFGYRQSWNFTINIKSRLLQDLKLDKKKDFRDF
ncbi:MAG: putative LPS assembly protein LptD [Bacteroidales bacterium]